VSSALLKGFAQHATKDMNTMRNATLLSILFIVGPCPAMAQKKYDFDGAHSLVRFTVELAGLTGVEGRFVDTNATISYDQTDLSKSSVTALIHTASIDTGEKERDEHLRTSDFFDAEKFPIIRFQSKRIEKRDSNWVAVGELTIHGVTHEIELPFQWVQKIHTDPFGNDRIGFEAHMTLKRSDYGIKGPRFWGEVISDDVDILLRVSARIYNWDHIDPASEKGKKSVVAEIFPLFQTGNPDALKRLVEIQSSSPCDYDLGEWPMHALVRKLAQHGKIKEALEVSKKISEANPRSSLALDDLAQNYEDAGDRQHAFALYKSSVAINPFDSYAAEGLRLVSRAPTP
jgi:polyisoprenoid-binding protein YceI